MIVGAPELFGQRLELRGGQVALREREHFALERGGHSRIQRWLALGALRVPNEPTEADRD
jgi:hypothetical protein